MLVYGCKDSEALLKNEIRFITFNYDTSIEYYLHRGLSSIDLIKSNHVESFLRNDRILHVYGSVRNHIPTENDIRIIAALKELRNPLDRDSRSSIAEALKVALDKCLEASDCIRTIEAHDKEENGEVLKRARQFIAEAKIIYILGYSFDEKNNLRIGLDPALRKTSPKRYVMFTNYGDTNIVNKRVSRLCFGSYGYFHGHTVPRVHSDQFIEKSTNNVYEAFQRDFDVIDTGGISWAPR